MSIIRVEKTKGFSIIKNTILNDTRLSYRAIGIAAHLLSKPDGWQIRAEYLWKNGVEGREAVRAAMKELENCGYLLRITSQNEKGHWVTDLILKEEADETVQQSPTPGKPSVGKLGANTYTEYEVLNNSNHSGQTNADALDEGVKDLFFSSDVLDEKEEVGAVIEKPATKEHSSSVPYTINLTVAGESIEYQTFSPKFRNGVERLRWVKFVEDFFTSLTNSEKEHYLDCMTRNKTFFDKAREHVRIVSWMLFDFGANLLEMRCHSKYFWWKGCADIYNLCDGDCKLLIYLIDSALRDGGKEAGFALDNPASFYACMKKDMRYVKEFKEQGFFEEVCQRVLAGYGIKLD